MKTTPTSESNRNSQPQKVVTVFLSCPGDMENEKNRLESVVHDLNSNFQKIGLLVIPWRHERDVVPNVAQDAQEVINEQTPDYDVYVGVMCGRLGTPTARAESGTLEELMKARARFHKEQKPKVLFYFCCNPVEEVKRIQKEFSGIYSVFDSAVALESKFKNHMTSILLDELFTKPDMRRSIVDQQPYWAVQLGDHLNETIETKPDTFLNYSSNRVLELMRRYEDLLDLKTIMTEEEVTVLLASEYLLTFLLLNSISFDEDNRQGIEHRILQGSLSSKLREAIYLAMRGANSRVDLNQISEASPSSIRCDLIAGILRVGEIIGFDQSFITSRFQGSAPTDHHNVNEWLALYTEKISIQPNKMTFYLAAHTSEIAELLKWNTALRIEPLWQNNRKLFVKNNVVLGTDYEVRVSPEIAKLPDEVHSQLQARSSDIKNAIPHLTHLGQPGLGKEGPDYTLDELIPLPESAIAGPLKFSLNRNFHYQLVVSSHEVHDNDHRELTLDSQGTDQIVLPPTLLVQGIHYEWRLFRDDQDLGYAQEAAGEVWTLSLKDLWLWNYVNLSFGLSERRVVQFKLRLWNDILTELWPKLCCHQVSIEEYWFCHRILVSAYQWVLENSPESTRLEAFRNAENWVYARTLKG